MFNHHSATQNTTLVYGGYLKEGASIVDVKQSSFIKTVDSAKLIDEFYEPKIADDDRQDAYIKKSAANENSVCWKNAPTRSQ